MSKKSFFNKKEKKEIFYYIINSFLAGALVLLGAFSTGIINQEAIFTAIIVSVMIGVTKFKEYWDGEQKEYVYNFAKFI